MITWHKPFPTSSDNCLICGGVLVLIGHGWYLWRHLFRYGADR